VLIPAVRTSRAAWTFADAQIIGIVVNLLYVQFCKPVRRRLGFLGVMPGRMLFRFLLCFPVFVIALSTYFDFSERRSPIFVDAIHAMNDSEAAKSDLGAPIKIGWPVSGETELMGDHGHTILYIVVSGTRDEGTLTVAGTKTKGVWAIDGIKLRLKGGSTEQDLMQTDPQVKRVTEPR
jgi:hypothetical protein